MSETKTIKVMVREIVTYEMDLEVPADLTRDELSAFVLEEAPDVFANLSELPPLVGVERREFWAD